MRATLCTTVWVQDYDVPCRAVLCTTRLRCAPLGCVVHHSAALCTMVHKGGIYSFEAGFAPDIFHIEHGHFFSIFGGTQEHTIDTVHILILAFWLDDKIDPLVHAHSKICILFYFLLINGYRENNIIAVNIITVPSWQELEKCKRHILPVIKVQDGMWTSW